MADEAQDETEGPAERESREHRWWPAGALPCAKAIVDAGDRLAYVRIVVDKSRKGDPMTFQLVYKDDTLAGPMATPTFNDSWACPPFCGGGGG